MIILQWSDKRLDDFFRREAIGDELIIPTQDVSKLLWSPDIDLNAIESEQPTYTSGEPAGLATLELEGRPKDFSTPSKVYFTS